MPLFSFKYDLGARRQEAQKAAQLATRRAALRDVLLSRDGLPTAPDALAGVTGDNAVADLQAELANEDAARAAGSARGNYDASLVDALVGLQASGIDASKISSVLDATERRRAIDGVRGELPTSQYIDALNNKSIAPYSLSEAGIVNQYTGDYRSTPSVEALTQQRRMKALAELAASGNSDALAAYNQARANGEQFRNRAVEDILSEPINPLIAADIANRRTVGTPQRVKVRLKDGSEKVMNATPNLKGGFDYTEATAGGEPLVSAPGGTDGQTPLQKDTAFIAETLKMQPNEALLFKLWSARKSPAEAWADLVARTVSANKYDDADAIREKATALWAVARPGQPVPVGASGPSAQTDDGQAQDAKARAAAEGYSNLGQWVPGKGVEVLDNSGRVIGHYY